MVLGKWGGGGSILIRVPNPLVDLFQKCVDVEREGG